MNTFDNIIEKLKKEYDREDILCFFITGSVARGEAYEGNDLDALFVTKNDSFHKEYREGKSLLEISGNTFHSYMEALEKNPMLVYMYMDARAIFAKDDSLEKLKQKAEEILKNYKSSEEERQAIKKWLASVVDKVAVAKEHEDNLKVGFHISNVVWKVVEGFYAINNAPVPASTSALRRITNLSRKPDNFEELWRKTLLGTLEERTEATMQLMKFILTELS